MSVLTYALYLSLYLCLFFYYDTQCLVPLKFILVIIIRMLTQNIPVRTHNISDIKKAK